MNFSTALAIAIFDKRLAESVSIFEGIADAVEARDPAAARAILTPVVSITRAQAVCRKTGRPIAGEKFAEMRAAADRLDRTIALLDRRIDAEGV